MAGIYARLQVPRQCPVFHVFLDDRFKRLRVEMLGIRDSAAFLQAGVVRVYWDWCYALIGW